MSASCCGCAPEPGGNNRTGGNNRKFRSVLWAALAINLAMFAVEIGGSILSGSSALQADALDFPGGRNETAHQLVGCGLGARVARPRRAH